MPEVSTGASYWVIAALIAAYLVGYGIVRLCAAGRRMRDRDRKQAVRVYDQWAAGLDTRQGAEARCPAQLVQWLREEIDAELNRRRPTRVLAQGIVWWEGSD